MARVLAMKEKYPLSSRIIQNYAPATWTPMSPSQAVELVKLPSNSQEFLSVLNKVRSTMPRIQVRNIVRVQNPYLWGVYSLKRAENPNVPEITLFHATEASRVPFITANNLDFYGILMKDYVKFGRTAEFAEMCSDMPRTSNRAMIQARVLDTPPSVPSDTPIHLTRIGTVYRKEDYNEYYPEYVVYHYTADPYHIYTQL